jgi:hypothetical protein
VTLADLVFRRSALGAAGVPERGAVQTAARVMGGELGWDATRQGDEIEVVMREAGAPGPALETIA